MSKFLKHVGKHGDRKVAVIFRQIPGDDHMCLVVYTELLNQNIHDPLMTCIESPQGQAVENLADALNRVYTKDGNIILQVLHREGMMKKVQSEHVMMTPAPNTKIKLSELNGILNEMAKGEDAIRKLAEIDASRGLQDPKDVAKRMRGESTVNLPPPKTPAPGGVLDNSDLANNLRAQALRMTNEAKGLLAEADRLIREASGMEPAVVKKARVKKVKDVVESPPQIPPPPQAPAKRAGRPKKAAIAG